MLSTTIQDMRPCGTAFPVSRPTVLIFRDRLLLPSETFVRSQAEALRDFVPYYVGATRENGIALPRDRTVLVGGPGPVGKIRELSFKLLGVAPRTVRACRELNPALMHVHFGPDAARAFPLARKLNIPLLITFHGFDATKKDEYGCRSSHAFRTYVRRRRSLQQHAAGFLAVSNFIKTKLVERGFSPDKITVHYVGVDTNLFRPEQDVVREPVVLFVGRLVENKGCEYLIRAMCRIQQVLPQARLVIIGDGPLRSRLTEAARNLHNCTFLGVQPPEVVRSWMNRSKVFCVPSVTIASGESEGFGLVFTEAQAMGLPVVSFATGGISEAVADGETGLLAPERQWEDLAAKLQLLLTNGSMWETFSGAGRKRVERMYNLQDQSRKLEQIYRVVVRHGRLSSAITAAPSFDCAR